MKRPLNIITNWNGCLPHITLTDELENDMNRENSDICLLSPTTELAEMAEDATSKRGLNIDICVVSLVEACDVVKKKIENGTQIFISRRGTRALIEEDFGIHVVDIDLKTSDYISVMEQATNVNGKVAFFTYNDIRSDIKAMCYLLKVEAKYYQFRNRNDCDLVVMRAIEDGCVLGVGGAGTAYFAALYGLEHIIVENSEESLMDAINTAQQLLQIKNEETEKQRKLSILLEQYKTIFDYTHDAIVAVDNDGKIEMINLRGEELVNIEGQRVIGKHIDQIIPGLKMNIVLKSKLKELNQILSINGVLASANLVPIVVDDSIQGIVVTIQDMKTLQDGEIKIRLKLHQKGLVAKYTFEDIFEKSKAMSIVKYMARMFAATESTILIQGETGTGKELFAQSIHNASVRAEGPFVAVNCGSLPKNLLEAELFGYESGSFTGATKSGKVGLFEMAHRGTIFLDEIGEMPLETQVQLLRVLQEKEIRRIGSEKVTPVDIRVITATNRNLMDEVECKRFREDLYYRLNVLSLELPPLRERKEDIPELGRVFCAQFIKDDHQGCQLAVSKLLSDIEGYSWPGNVRELRNLVERVCVLHSQGHEVDFIPKHMERHFKHVEENGSNNEKEPADLQQEDRKETRDVQDLERNKILTILEVENFALSKSAQRLGMSRSTLWRKIKKYGIKI